MRGRLRRLGGRAMARRPGDEGSSVLNLPPDALRIGGWVVAILLIAGIALVVGIFGGDADTGPLGTSPSASGAAAAPEIAFGTALDPATGEVATAAQTDRFAAGDTFAYSITSQAPLAAIYVEVRRTGGGVIEIAQAPVEAQRLSDPDVIAFQVATDSLLAAFGPGEYLMLIYDDPEADPLAEGTFILVGATVSPAASASASP